MTTPKETITGEISAIRFRNAEGWAVFSLAGKHLGFIGTLASICEVGTEVTCTGTRETGKYGAQLKCETIVPASPDISTAQGVIKLLQRLPGIGPAKAKTAVDNMGHEEAWRLAQEDPAKLGVKESATDQAKNIAASLFGSYAATVYLLGIGLTDHQASIIHKRYGNDTIKTVSQAPYDLTEIDGFGFITVDKIALKAGISVSNQSRLNACILYVLEDNELSGGNIWHNGWALIDIVLSTLTETAQKAEVSLLGAPTKDEVRKQVHFLAAEGKLIVEKGRVYSERLLTAERAVLEFMGVEA